MTIHVDAIYQDGVLLPKVPVALPNGTKVSIAIVPLEPSTDPLAKVLGIADGPSAGDASDRHDDYLYGTQ